MRPTRVASAAFVGALCAAVGCGPSGGDPATGPAKRIVSVAPSCTEILFAIGAEDRLVAVSTADTYPPEVKRLPTAGDLGKPDLEALARLKPDLVVYTEMMKPGLAEQIERLGIRTLRARQDSFSDVFDAVLLLGRAAGAEQRAEELVASLRARVRRVEERVARVPVERRPRVFIEITPTPLYTAGGTSYMDELVRRAGGVNVAGDQPEGYLKVSGEFVVRADPDVILLSYMYTEMGAEADVARRIGWDRIKAVREGRIIADIHPDLLCRPGPRLVDGLEALHERLYPAGPAGATPPAPAAKGDAP